MPQLDATLSAPDAIEAAYDYIVIGGGSGGAVVARRLAENPAVKVLLIEAGPNDRGITEIADAASWTSLFGGPYDWGYIYAPAPNAHGRRIDIPRGKVLGGSSSINAMMWYRGHRSDYDRWEQDGATGWGFDSVLPFFKRAEDWIGGETRYRGASGPLRIERSRDPHPLAAALLPACAALGVPVIDDCNGADNEGACLSNHNLRGQQRWSVTNGYLHDVAGWPNLVVLTSSFVLGLMMDGRRCVGVRHQTHGTPRTTRATTEVILAAGAFGTPRLLMLSGIGDPAELARLDIAVHTALPGVGRNLQDHPLTMGVNFYARTPLGPMRDQGGGTMVNWKSSPSEACADLHAFVVQGPHAVPSLQSQIDPSLPCFAISPGLMRSESRGALRLLGNEPDAAMEIQPNYFAEPSDLRKLADAVDFVMTLAETDAYRDLVLRPATPARRLSHTERIDFVRQSVATFFHACGTCAMGQSEASVVDPQLRVHGLDGLRIVDASVIPTIPTCNTHAPVVMIAERAADLILGRVST